MTKKKVFEVSIYEKSGDRDLLYSHNIAVLAENVRQARRRAVEILTETELLISTKIARSSVVETSTEAWG